MNAGRDYRKACAQAQANADWSGAPRWLSLYNGVWWISKTPILDATRIDPTPGRAGVLDPPAAAKGRGGAKGGAA